MFQNWGFLLGEIWILILLAALLGLFAGWLIWGKCDCDEHKDYDGDGVVEGENEGVKPTTLDAARGGEPDDLKLIKGVGPQLEKLCHKLGFYHFDQVAAWTAEEVAWVDANLEGFKGRVSRDDWVAQAKLLAAGGETEFSKRAKDGEVY